MSKTSEETPHVRHVEVDVASEVGANVGRRVHQGAVERGPAYADHHGNQTQQDQDQAGVSAHLVCVGRHVTSLFLLFPRLLL